MKKMLFFLMCLMVGLASASQVQAATLYVDINNPNCSDQNGNPYCHIQPAINAAAPRDTIQVAAGTYFENLTIQKSLALQGAGETQTIIDGQFTNTVVTISKGSRVKISDVTIQRGATYGGSGGGINNAGRLSLSHSTVTNNTAYDGGGISNTGWMSLDHAAVNGNAAYDFEYGGAGIFNSGQLTLIHTQVNGNEDDCGAGSGIFQLQGTLALNYSTVNSNLSQGCVQGPGVKGRRTGLPPRVQGQSPDDYGGGPAGLYVSNGTVTISNSTISGNNGIYWGAIGFGGGNITLANSTVSGNNYPTISNSAILSVINSTISNNSTGIDNHGTLWLNNATISDNSYTGLHTFAGMAWLQNTLVANNYVNCLGTLFTSNGYNLSSDRSCHFHNTGDLNKTDPLLGKLKKNGGPTETRALLPGSPAIDAGNPAPNDGQGSDCEPTDQRGVPRTDRCDIGAYEYP